MTQTSIQKEDLRAQYESQPSRNLKTSFDREVPSVSINLHDPATSDNGLEKRSQESHSSHQIYSHQQKLQSTYLSQ